VQKAGLEMGQAVNKSADICRFALNLAKNIFAK